jgi:hypothetical protein
MKEGQPEHPAPSAARKDVRPRYRRVVVVCDRAYRWIHRLDHPDAEVGPVLRLEVQRGRAVRVLPDGTVLRPGDRIGALHLHNERLATIHVDGRSPRAVGFEFRRQFIASLRALAALACAGGPLGDVQAFSVTTIFYNGVAGRLGFVPEPGAPVWPRVVAAYQRALLASVHPAGTLRLSGSAYRRARRLWLTRATLLTLYGDASATRAGLSRAAGGA